MKYRRVRSAKKKKKFKKKKKNNLTRKEQYSKVTVFQPTKKWIKTQERRIKRRIKLKLYLSSRIPKIVQLYQQRRNIYLYLKDVRGAIKYSLSTGRLGFKGRSKYAYQAIVSLAQEFLKELKNRGVRHILFNFCSKKRTRKAFIKGVKTTLYSGMWEGQPKWKWLKWNYGDWTKGKQKWGWKKVEWFGNRWPLKMWLSGIILTTKTQHNGSRRKKKRRL